MMTPEKLALVAFLLGFFSCALLIGSVASHADTKKKRRERDRKLRAELEALRAANRLNVAYWQTKQQMNRAAGRPRRAAVRR